MPANLKAVNASTGGSNDLLNEYRRKKQAYRDAGAAAKGTPEGSPERIRYAHARAEYQAAGKALAESRGR
jgi:hypothetical protein